MNSLEAKVAIVTGGASGIGAATARALARAGASVAVADIQHERASKVVEEIEAGGGSAVAVRTDVSQEDSVAALVSATIERFGRLDILHNNAALLQAPKGASGPIHSIDVDGWDALYAVNVRGVMLGTKHALPHMLSVGGGSIINTTSSSDRLGDLDSAYSSAKGAVSSFTRSTAAQYGRQGIRVNAIAPGLMLHENNEAHIDDAMRALWGKHHLLSRLGTADDVADAVVFLSSDAASFITGQVLGVDGGLATHLPYIGDFLAQ